MKIQWVSNDGDITITIEGNDASDCVFKANCLLKGNWMRDFHKGDMVKQI